MSSYKYWSPQDGLNAHEILVGVDLDQDDTISVTKFKDQDIVEIETGGEVIHTFGDIDVTIDALEELVIILKSIK